jgi:hypothetical protein
MSIDYLRLSTSPRSELDGTLGGRRPFQSAPRRGAPVTEHRHDSQPADLAQVIPVSLMPRDAAR